MSDPITPATPLSPTAQLSIVDVYHKETPIPPSAVLDAMVNKVVELGPQALALQQSMTVAMTRRDTDEEIWGRYASARSTVDRCANANEAAQFASQLLAQHRILFPK